MLFILKRIGFFVVDNWKYTVPVILIGVLIFVVVISRSCGHKPKLNEKQIQQAQTAIATQDRATMEKVLVESDVAEKQIDANVANAEVQKLNAITEAKTKAAQMTNEELAAELERRAQ